MRSKEVFRAIARFYIVLGQVILAALGIAGFAKLVGFGIDRLPKQDSAALHAANPVAVRAGLRHNSVVTVAVNGKGGAR